MNVLKTWMFQTCLRKAKALCVVPPNSLMTKLTSHIHRFRWCIKGKFDIHLTLFNLSFLKKKNCYAFFLKIMQDMPTKLIPIKAICIRGRTSWALGCPWSPQKILKILESYRKLYFIFTNSLSWILTLHNGTQAKFFGSLIRHKPNTKRKANIFMKPLARPNIYNLKFKIRS